MYQYNKFSNILHEASVSAYMGHFMILIIGFSCIFLQNLFIFHRGDFSVIVSIQWMYLQEEIYDYIRPNFSPNTIKPERHFYALFNSCIELFYCINNIRRCLNISWRMDPKVQIVSIFYHVHYVEMVCASCITFDLSSHKLC